MTRSSFLSTNRRGAIGILLAGALLESSALATPVAAVDTPQEGGYSYELEADFLDGVQLVGNGALIRVNPRPARVLLIRPRVSFVPELLKSVQAL